MSGPATSGEHGGAPVHLPDPTPWPMVLALGITLLAVGLIAGPRVALGPVPLPVVSLLGAVVALVALFRLIREDIRHYGTGGPT